MIFVVSHKHKTKQANMAKPFFSQTDCTTNSKNDMKSNDKIKTFSSMSSNTANELDICVNRLRFELGEYPSIHRCILLFLIFHLLFKIIGLFLIFCLVSSL